MMPSLGLKSLRVLWVETIGPETKAPGHKSSLGSSLAYSDSSQKTRDFCKNVREVHVEKTRKPAFTYASRRGLRRHASLNSCLEMVPPY